jgi:hypothetical protein
MMIISSWDICVSDIRALVFLGGLLTDSNWVFAKSGGGERPGFNDAGIDTFKNKKVRSVAREVIQNSLDAAAQDGVPVDVRVETFDLSREDAPEFFSLKEHFQSCLNEADAKDQQNFFSNAIKKMETSKLNGLLFHDSNTTGLIGAIDSKGPWMALTRSSGVTIKSSVAGGTFGHGARAPFALSGLRTVLYISQVQHEGRTERRAVGRSVLMNHLFENDDRQAVGFFGKGPEAAPLIGSEIPEWLDNLRPRELGDGTTIAVFDARHQKFWEKFQYEVIRSYSLAIDIGQLRVHIDKDVIDDSSLKRFWESTKKELDQDESNEDPLTTELDSKAVATVLYPEQTLEVDSALGKCELRIRSGENLGSRQVSISRGRGMLITTRPSKLERFSGLNYFDCVVWVKDVKGSGTLSKLENPTHDEFSEDWLEKDEASDHVDPWGAYVSFAKTIRDKISSLFKIEQKDTLELDVLTQLGAGWDQAENDRIGTGRSAHLVSRSSQKRGAIQGSNGIAGPSRRPRGGGGGGDGRRLIPSIDGGDVSTDGWRTIAGFAKCSTREDGNELVLRADFPSALEQDTGILFCAISAEGGTESLIPAVRTVQKKSKHFEERIKMPGKDYSIEVIMFNKQSGARDNGNS